MQSSGQISLVPGRFVSPTLVELQISEILLKYLGLSEGVLKTLLDIYGGGFCKNSSRLKKTPSQICNRLLNTIIKNASLAFAKAAIQLNNEQRVMPMYRYKKKNKSRSSYRKCSVKKSVLKNVAIFMVKHLCWCLFLIKLQV